MRNRKKILIIISSFLGILLLITILIFTQKNRIIEYFLTKANQKLENKLGLTFSYDSFELEGYKSLNFKNFKVNEKSETIILIEDFKIEPSIRKLLRSRIEFNQILAHKGEVNLKKLSLILDKNKNDKIDSTSIKTKIPFKKLYRVADAALTILKLIPENVQVSDFNILPLPDSFYLNNIYLNRLTLLDNRLNAEVNLTHQDLRTQKISLDALVDNNNSNYSADIESIGEAFWLPPKLKNLNPNLCGFKKLEIKAKTNQNKDNVEIDFTSINLYNSYIYHPKFNEDSVEFNKISFNGNLTLSDSTISLQKSEVTLNQLPIEFLIEAKAQDTSETIKCEANFKNIDAKNFFTSLPSSVFPISSTIEAEGKLNYDFNFFIDLKNLDSLKVSSVLSKSSDFKILSLGDFQTQKLTGNFTYIPYKSNRKIVIDRTSDNYLKIDTVKDYLMNAIITREDPGFKYHRGFETDAIESAFRYNIKKGRFARGGSTITMQLVKNLFLSHKKVLSRKIEEILLVWLIEENRLASKRNILETYVNIIEWGPGIHGVKEASQYYFNKIPYQLTLNEAVFLALIIPKPKSYAYQFDSLGLPKPYFQRQMKSTINKMAIRKLLPEQDTIGYVPNVQLTGPAKQNLKIKEEVDFELIEEIEDF